MSVSVSQNMDQFSPSKVTEENGIVSIIGSDCQGAKTASASLKRILSADMSPKNWSAENAFSSLMKKIASHEQLAISAADSSSSFNEEEDYEATKDELNRSSQSEIWISIQSDKKDGEIGTQGQSDIWSSILSRKADEPSKLPPPYIHPLVKRSSSSLSEKSLEICTESLGSETGSDGFSSYPSSGAGDVEADKELKQQEQEERDFQSFDKEEFQIPKYNHSYKKPTQLSFPPPIPSRTRGSDEPSVQMHTYRKDGRLVLQAISVSPQNSFHAHRQDGRLLLTLVSNPEEDGLTHDEMKEDGAEEEEMEEEEMNYFKDNEMGFLMEKAPELTSGAINVQGTALMMKKLTSSDNMNCMWPPNFNKSVNLVELEVDDEEEEELRQSVPPLPRVSRLIPAPSPQTPPPTTPASAALVNTYEYPWRIKPVVASIINPITKQSTTLKNSSNKDILSNSQKMYKQQELVIMRGNKGDYLVPLLRGCKEPRRSLLIWEPYCIAT